MRRLLILLLAMSAALPPAALADTLQIVHEYVDEPVPWAFIDPCSGVAVEGIGTESGIVRVTELGELGEHVRVRADGVVDLFATDGTFVGTWTYAFTAENQIPPEEQGALIGRVAGRLEYADGSDAFITERFLVVFEKGNSPKRVMESSACIA